MEKHLQIYFFKKTVNCTNINHLKSLCDCLLKARDKWEKCVKRMDLIISTITQIMLGSREMLIVKFVWYCAFYKRPTK
jgi:hypothetical protein